MAFRSFRLLRAEILFQGRCLEHQQQSRQSSFGDFFKRLKSEAEKNPDLQKSINELRKSGEAFRERSKSVSQAVTEAASASAEAARSATAGLRQQAGQATSSVQETVSQASKGVRDSISGQFTDDAPGSKQGAEAPKEPAAQPASQQASATAQQQPPSAQRSSPSEAAYPQAASPQPQQQQQQQQGEGTTGRPFMGQESQSGRQQAGAESSTGREQAGPGKQAGPGEGASREEQPGQAGTKQPRESMLSRVQRAARAVRSEVAAAINPEDAVHSATRASGVQERQAEGGPSELMAVAPSRWSQQWRYLEDKLGLHPLFRRVRALRDHKVVNRSREIAEDLQTRWEMSDSPLVQRMQDMKDSMFSESEMARAYREIRARDPRFDMVLFLQRLKKDVPVVVKGSMEGNQPVLKQHCAPEMVERFSGIHNAKKAQGLFEDTTILDWSDVELVDVKLHETNPLILVQFTCQHINCTRDKHGNVIEGSPSNVERKFYFWAVQQDGRGFVGVDGNAYPPRWQLREQAVSAAQNLL